MAERVIALSLGMSRAGLSDLKVRLLAPDGSVSEPDLGGTFTERGLGMYLWRGPVPGDFQGFLEFYRESEPAVSLAIMAMSPVAFDPDRDAVQVGSFALQAQGQVRGSLGLQEADLGQRLDLIQESADERTGFKLAADQDYNNVGQTKFLPVQTGPVSDAVAAKVWGYEGLDFEDAGGSTALDKTPGAVLRRLWRRFFRPADKTPEQVRLKSNEGAVVSTQQISDDGDGHEMQGSAS